VNGILDTSTVPASDAIAAQVPEARALAQKVAEALDYVGVLTLEFFATDDGPVFNEMAPASIIRAIGASRARSPASSKTIFAPSAACRWA
jgi:hypothetical protein